MSSGAAPQDEGRSLSKPHAGRRLNAALIMRRHRNATASKDGGGRLYFNRTPGPPPFSGMN